MVIRTPFAEIRRALLPQGPLCILDDLWVAPERIRTGVGRRLFGHALQRAGELGADQMEWEAEPNAAGLYLRMGRTTGVRRSPDLAECYR